MSKKLCVFGDSIAWGSGDPVNGGWVAQLRHYLETNNYDLRVYNQGISGEDTDRLLVRFGLENEVRNSEIIILAIGINDSQYIGTKDNPRVSLEKFQSNLNELISQANKTTKTIVFVEITNVDESLLTPVPWSDEKLFFDNDTIGKHNNVIKSVCNEHDLPFINLLNLLDTDDLEDGLHPNTNGHKKIFLKVKGFLTANKIV